MPPIFRSIVAALAAMAIGFSTVSTSFAQRKVSLVRDAEAEALIRDYTAPILKAAGLGGAGIEIKIVSDRSFNAFVADSRRIFLNAGTVIDSETPNELIGVIAHETGHLAGGHLIRLREAIARAQILTAIAMIGGAAAAVAGSSSGINDAGRAGAGIAVGGAQVGARSLLAYQRGEETTADRAAITYLEKTGQSGRGMLKTFKRLSEQQMFSSTFRDAYAMSHPLASERIVQLQEIAAASAFYNRGDDPHIQERHDLVRAKFIGFTGTQQAVQRATYRTPGGLPEAYARAIVAWRFGDPRGAVKLVDDLIRQRPDSPWFWELKGQILLEGGLPKEAIQPLRKAVSMAPKEGLIRVLLGQALVAAEDPALLGEAIAELTRGLGDDPDQAVGYRQLAIAYARKNDIPMANLATAQGEFAAGDIETAKQYAARAQANLKTGSPAWLRADDIVTYKAPSY